MYVLNIKTIGRLLIIPVKTLSRKHIEFLLLSITRGGENNNNCSLDFFIIIGTIYKCGYKCQSKV